MPISLNKNVPLRFRNSQKNGLIISATTKFDHILRDEGCFWNMMSERTCNTPITVWYKTDFVISDKINIIFADTGKQKIGSCAVLCTQKAEEKDRPPNQPTSNINSVSAHEERQTPYWTVDTLNSAALLCHMKDKPGLNSCKYNVGFAFPLFPFHVKDNNILSILFLWSGSSKVWYVISGPYQESLEHFEAYTALYRQYVNDYNNMVRQIIATKNILFNPTYLTWCKRNCFMLCIVV